MTELYDVLVIGGGVVGSAVARELSRYKLNICVLEKNDDVCDETSGRNSGVIHGGFAYDTGTLKARLCIEGNRMMDQLSGELGFKFHRCGKVLVGSTEEHRRSLAKTLEQGKRNGATGLSLIDDVELHHLVPHAAARFALFSKNSGIVDPFNYTIALAENAAQNGVRYFFNSDVWRAEYSADGYWNIAAGKKIFLSKWVVNAAGLGCGEISDMLGIKGYKIIGSKGHYIILDKRVGPLLPMPVYPVPSNTYMGIHVTNTVNGNVLIGPDAETVSSFSDYCVPQKNVDSLAENARRIWPCFTEKDYIGTYAGILSKLVDSSGTIQDFKIEIRPELAPCAVNLVGIESPGLTAAVPVARMAIEMMKEYIKLEPNPGFNPRRQGILKFADQSEEMKKRLIAQNPAYAEIICSCEQITKEELLQAVHNPLGVRSASGIRHRTGAMTGRCRGTACSDHIARLLLEQMEK